MSEQEQEICETILRLVPSDGTSITNRLLISELRRLLPGLGEAEYHFARDRLVEQGRLRRGPGRGGTVHCTSPLALKGSSVNRPDLMSAPDPQYSALNATLNRYYLSGRFEMLPIYLSLEADAENVLAEAVDLDPGELEDYIGLCVSVTLSFDKPDPYSDHVSWMRAWSDDGRREPPPFTGLLTAFSIAAKRMGVDGKFSPNNYYERLFELLGVTNATSQQKLKQCARSTRQFWRALNLWLSENDFLLGRPTAKALISHWQYASYALSQALVREADRKRFGGLFETYHLQPGDQVSASEMSLFVHDWMTKQGPSGPSAWLRKLWSSTDLRERVIAAALDELASWERTTLASASIGPRKARLQWEVAFSSFPTKRTRLLLTVGRGGLEEPLVADEITSPQEPDYYLEAGVTVGRQVLGPIGAINLDLMLVRSRTFTGAESGTSYAYVAKPIVAFVRSADEPTYIEVPRASLFDEHVILCHDAWLARVEGHLARCARPGYSVVRPSDSRGIPDGWCILRGVEIVRSLDHVQDNLFMLNPMGEAATVGGVGGLVLGHGTWHTDARPTVEATSELASSRLEIAIERFGEQDEVLVKVAAEAGLMEASLEPISIRGSIDLRAVVKAGSSEITECTLSLRSADFPRPLGNDRIYHAVDHEAGFRLAAAHNADVGENGLEGCLICGQVGSLAGEAVPFDPSGLGQLPMGSAEERPEFDWHRSPDVARMSRESCVIRGYHHWILQAFGKGDDRFEAKMGECRDCHVRALFRTRIAARGSLRRANAQGGRIPSRTTRAVELCDAGASSSAQPPVSLDTVFDALCYLGEGSWASFQRLASRSSPEPWFAVAFANDLFALGHMEMHDPFHGGPSRWSVPPPVLVLGLDQRAYLAGFHEKSLPSRIDAALAREGAKYEPVAAKDQLTLHRWSNLSGLDLARLLDSVVDAHGRRVSVARDLGIVIASNLPPLEMVWLRAPPVHFERRGAVSRFDVAATRWSPVDAIDGSGAFRIGLHGTRYVYRDAEGNTRQVGHRVAKILAARAEGISLHAYDSRTGRFTAALGADPPGLFARALVTSSGGGPAIEGGRLVYKNVDPVVARLVLSRLYGGGKQSG